MMMIFDLPQPPPPSWTEAMVDQYRPLIQMIIQNQLRLRQHQERMSPSPPPPPFPVTFNDQVQNSEPVVTYGQNQSSESVIMLLRQFSDMTAATATDDDGTGTGTASRSIPVLVLISIILICLILATIIGNVFVISAVVLERSLRTVGNYLVVSLAITDLLVACLVMPIAAIYEVSGGWTMGVKLCEIWTFVDVLCCTTSIFHLLAIACDRLWAVTTVDYIHRRKGKHVCIGIAAIWAFSAMISLGPMLGWKDAEFEKRILERQECLVSQELSYQIFATIASFYAPSILLLLQYYRIYQVAKARLKLKKQRYQCRVRRRPSFYRNRKESELKEFPRITHRVSINPSQEEFYSSTAVQPPPSSSGVYSSSTTATEHTNTTTGTTNTTLSIDRTSSISLSPPCLKQTNGPSGSSATATGSGTSINDSTGKRFSIVQFFHQHRKSETTTSGGSDAQQKMSMSTFDNDTDFRSNETSIDESTIIFTEAPTNIVVYVDDYGSTVCSCSNEASNGVSFFPTEYTNATGSGSQDDDFGDGPMEDLAAVRYRPTDEEEELEDDSMIGDAAISIKQSPPSEVLDTQTKNGKLSNNHNHLQLGSPLVAVDSPPPNPNPDVKNRHDSHNHHHHHNHRHHSGKKHKRRRIRKLQFRSKNLRLDQNQNSAEAKQESKAAKTLTIITGVFIICWLPFFVLALVMPLCGNPCPIGIVKAFDFSLWLGWANSTLNPFLYTIFSPDFRNAFKKLLKRFKKKQ